jgi:LysM repeat protein
VKAGDTPSSIARTCGVSLAQLNRMNPKLDPTRLKPGAKLRIADAAD